MFKTTIRFFQLFWTCLVSFSFKPDDLFRFQFKRFIRDQIWCRKQRVFRWFRHSFPGVAYLFADTDVLLSIHPVHKYHKLALTYHYPPPGYGLPPGYIPRKSPKYTDEYNNTIKQLIETKPYGLHIWPGRLWRVQWFYMLFMFPFILLPLNFQVEVAGNIISFISNFFVEIFALLKILYSFHINYWFVIVISLPITVIIFTSNFIQLINKLRLPLRKIHSGYKVFLLNLKTDKKNTILRSFIYLLFISGFGFLLYIFFQNPKEYYFYIFLMLLIFISLLLFRSLFHRTPPLLNKVWRKWPKTEYGLFLNVPHHVRLTWEDQLINRENIINDNALSRYWRCDQSTTFFQQSMYYAKKQKTLQEVLLHLALFDFLFHNKKTSDSKEGRSHFSALKFKSWLYIFTPIWLNFSILVISLTLMATLFSKSFTSSGYALSTYPYNFIWAVLIWAFISFLYIARWMLDLDQLNNDIHKGYFNKHLELVPQQILGAMTEIPDSEQIREAITALKQVMNITLASLTTAILVILEILANFFGN